MKGQINEMTERTAKIAGRFGFMSRSIFWQHLSRTQKSRSYLNWSHLLTSGLFKPYELSDEHLFMTMKGVQFLQERNCAYVGKAHPMNFEHDALVMSFALACENAGLIQPTWAPDAVIRKQTGLENLSLLGAAAPKIPDLVFDLSGTDSNIRMALEVERSRKSQARYDTLVLAYMEMKLINLAIIAYNDRYTENRISDSMKKLGYPQSKRPIAFCKLSDLSANPSSFLMRLNGNVIAFDKFVINLKTIETKSHAENQAENIPQDFPQKKAS